MEDQYGNDMNNSYYDGKMVMVIFWTTTSIFLPLAVLAIYSLYSLVRDDHVAPIFVINLLISDIIQICSQVVMFYGQDKVQLVFTFIWGSSVITSISCMVCVSLERYLVIAWPQCPKSIKVSVVVCVMVWILPLVSVGLFLLIPSAFLYQVLSHIFLLLPFSMLLFSLVRTIKGLSAAISVSSEEKRRIVGVLILVLLNYTLLFLPSIFFVRTLSQNYTFLVVAQCLLYFSPLADLFLYVFMRKEAVDKLLASLCCCRMEAQQE